MRFFAPQKDPNVQIGLAIEPSNGNFSQIAIVNALNHAVEDGRRRKGGVCA